MQRFDSENKFNKGFFFEKWVLVYDGAFVY